MSTATSSTTSSPDAPPTLGNDVENHARFVEVIQKTFLNGHAFTVVPTVAGAKELLSQGIFDAVLLDYDLDDGKGTEVVSTVFAMIPRLPIIAASSHDEGNARLREAGADFVCAKREFAGIEGILRELHLPVPPSPI